MGVLGDNGIRCTQSPLHLTQLRKRLSWSFVVISLQKQSGYFNHRVVTLVAVKLKDSGYRKVYFGSTD